MLVYHSAHSVSTSLITSFGPTENSVSVFVCPSSTARFGSVVHVCIIYALWLVSQWRGVSWKKVRMRTYLPCWFSHFRQRLFHTYNKKLLGFTMHEKLLPWIFFFLPSFPCLFILSWCLVDCTKLLQIMPNSFHSSARDSIPRVQLSFKLIMAI